MEQHLLKVQGMTCASCAAIIERSLKKVEGVASVSVNVATEEATIEHDPSVSLEQMNNVLRDHGYTLTASDQSEKKSAHHDHLHAGRAEELARMRPKSLAVFGISLVIFLLMIGEIVFSALGREFFLPVRGWQMVQFFVATLILAWAGRPFFAGVLRFVRRGSADMNTLIGIGTTVAYLYSSFVLLFPSASEALALPEAIYFDAAIVIIGFVTFGKYLELRSKIKTGEAIEALLKIQATVAHIKNPDGSLRDIPVGEIAIGNLLLVRLGEKIPTDAVVVEGETHIDESMITGESFPVKRVSGDPVIGSTINTQGVITVRAEKIGSDTVLSQIIRLVREAQGSKAPIQKLADRISAVFVPTVLGIALLSVVFWFVFGSRFAGSEQVFSLALSAFVGVLVIACPCALGLATPTAIIVGTGSAARNGILIKNAESLERAHRVDAVIFDKTGTLTEGRPKITNISVLSADHKEDDLLRLAASIEQYSDHPLAKAVVNSARERAIDVRAVTGAKEISGAGIEGGFAGATWYLGNEKMLQHHDVALAQEVSNAAEKLKKEGKTVIYVAQKNGVHGLLALADTIKSSSKEALVALRHMKVQTVLLTGDNTVTAQSIAAQVGIKQVFAEVKPEEKAQKVKELQQAGRIVAMVGDGINDAPALAQADVGIAMSTGTDVAIESADITLLHGDIRKVTLALRLSQRTMRIIKQNLFWAFFYNVVGIPLAAGWFYPLFGWQLSPAFAGMAMAFSSVSVLSNSLRLRRKK